MAHHVMKALVFWTALTSVNAYWLMGVENFITTERLDPLVNPGKISGHVHSVLGGSNFRMSNVTTDSLRNSECTSIPIKEDKSLYWFPHLYFQWANGSFTSLDGGAVIYYLFSDKPGTTTAFPKNFGMLAGDPTKRTYDPNNFAQKAVTFLCLDFNGVSSTHNEFPTKVCPSGIRAQINFPSCWDGKNLDSPDHKSHVAYLSEGADKGTCKDPKYPITLPRIFMEVYWGSQSFDKVRSQAKNPNQPFVYSYGDPTGYGYHADFMNGWDSGVLEKAVDGCTCNQFGDPQCCADKGIFTLTKGKQCRITRTVDEQTTGTLPKLPGNNPVQPAGAPATMFPDTNPPRLLSPVYAYTGNAPPAQGLPVPPASGGPTPSSSAPVKPSSSANTPPASSSANVPPASSSANVPPASSSANIPPASSSANVPHSSSSTPGKPSSSGAASPSSSAGGSSSPSQPSSSAAAPSSSSVGVSTPPHPSSSAAVPPSSSAAGSSSSRPTSSSAPVPPSSATSRPPPANGGPSSSQIASSQAPTTTKAGTQAPPAPTPSDDCDDDEGDDEDDDDEDEDGEVKPTSPAPTTTKAPTSPSTQAPPNVSSPVAPPPSDDEDCDDEDNGPAPPPPPPSPTTHTQAPSTPTNPPSAPPSGGEDDDEECDDEDEDNTPNTPSPPPVTPPSGGNQLNNNPNSGSPALQPPAPTSVTPTVELKPAAICPGGKFRHRRLKEKRALHARSLHSSRLFMRNHHRAHAM